MASYVFTYENESYPNIHGHASSYQGKVLQAYSNKSNFQNIKSRYLATMQQQLAAQQTNPDSKSYIEGLSLAEFEQLESQIEEDLVVQYNQKAEQLAAKTTLYTDTVRALEATLKGKTDKNVALQLVDQLIGVFKSNPQGQALIDDINATPGKIRTDIDIEDIVRARNLKSMVDKIFDEDTKFSAKWLSSVLTAPSEALAAYIDAYAEGVSDETVWEVVQRSMVGAQSVRTTAFVPLKEGFKELKPVETKAADVQLSNIAYQQKLSLKKNGVEETIDITVTPYASVKTYRTNEALKLTSYSGVNSLVIPALLQIYGDTIDIKYHIYNALAFSKSQATGTIMDTNFRIIRQDMITLFAERFIAGFGTEQAQHLLIHNFTAYPILAVLSAIIEDAQKQEQAYGSLAGGDLFSISFGNVDNTYVGETNNLKDKATRVRKVKAAIDRLSSRGKLSQRALTQVDKKYLKDGIPIKDLQVDKR